MPSISAFKEVTWTTGYDIDPYYLVEQGIVVNKTA
jgi:hypothetical protein